MAEERKPLGQLVADLQREFGPHYYGRRDLHITEELKQSAVQRARSEQTNHLGRYSIKRKEGLDGVKFYLDAPTNGNGAEPWVLFRMSGTEPLLRVVFRGGITRSGERYSFHCRSFCPESVRNVVSGSIDGEVSTRKTHGTIGLPRLVIRFRRYDNQAGNNGVCSRYRSRPCRFA